MKTHPQLPLLTRGLTGDATATWLARAATPTARERVRSAGTDLRRRGPPLRVLIIDDYPDAGETLAVLLKLFGHKVELARGGEEACRKAAVSLPNVLLVDIGLPGEDGYAVAKRLRELLPSKPLIIALTGYGQAKDRQRSLDEGFDHHLLKPHDPSELECLLQQFAATEAARMAQQSRQHELRREATADWHGFAAAISLPSMTAARHTPWQHGGAA